MIDYFISQDLLKGGLSWRYISASFARAYLGKTVAYGYCQWFEFSSAKVER